MKKLLAFVVVLLFLSGCAATGPKYQQTVYATQPVPEDNARIYFLRESAYLAGARAAPLFIDGDAIDKIANGGFIVVDVTPGLHEISSQVWDWPGRYAINAKFEAAKSYYIQVSVREESRGHLYSLGLIGGLIEASLADDRGLFQLVPINEPDALKKLQDLQLSN